MTDPRHRHRKSRTIDHSQIDVEDFLTSLEVDNLQRATTEELQFSCPFPGHDGGDRNPSAYMNTGELEPHKTSLWHCHGCKRGGDAVNFLAEYAGITLQWAIKFVKERYDAGFREPEDGSMVKELDAFYERQKHITVREGPQESIAESFRGHFDPDNNRDIIRSLEYLKGRGLDPQTIYKWRLGYDPIQDRVTIPVNDDQGQLVGFKGRAIDANVKPKYKVIGDRPGMDRYGFPIYNPAKIVFAAETIKDRHGEIILVEGELNAIKMHELGFTNTVAIGGSHFSSFHTRILRRIGQSVTLLYDTDEAGSIAAAKTIKIIEPFMRVYVCPDHDGDPMDMDRSTIEELLRERQTSLAIAFDSATM